MARILPIFSAFCEVRSLFPFSVLQLISISITNLSSLVLITVLPKLYVGFHNIMTLLLPETLISLSLDLIIGDMAFYQNMPSKLLSIIPEHALKTLEYYNTGTCPQNS